MAPRPLDAILKPQTIAVIGASRTANTIGNQIVSNLVRQGFTGAVYPVNPRATAIHALPCYASVGDIPDPIDLAIVSVPKEAVLAVARDCVDAGVRGLVVISAGFREIGGAGAERERELLALVRSAGIHMIGPNCMGVLNANPEYGMNATFAPTMPPAGNVAFVSQSGALGLSVLDYAREYGIGISQFVSVGNKADVSGNDLLVQWENDADVSVILMYVESFGNPQKFLEIATRITRRKPIVALKSGRSSAGAGAASSHTGALAASDVAVDALLAQAGVLRASSVEELFDIAMAFGSRGLPRSRRTAVLTNAGGPAILLADALEAQQLQLPALAQETVDSLKPVLAEEAAIRNPLDMIASANPESYRLALGQMLRDPGIDSVVAVFVPPMGVRQQDVAEAIVSAASVSEKPVLAVLMGREGLPQGRSELKDAGIPAYIFPESAARALAALCRYQERLDRSDAHEPPARANTDVARKLIDGVRAAQRLRLLEHEALQLVEAYGVPVAAFRFAATRDAAVAAAAEIGLPVVLKIVSRDVVHKSDVGGVRAGIRTLVEVADAFDAILNAAAAARAELSGVLVQRMAHSGRELIVGSSRDPQFGPLVMFGLGGVLVEVVQDVVFRLAPLSSADAREMLRQIRGTRILAEFRGQPAIDQDALVAALRAVARLAVDFPEIGEIEINPLLAAADGMLALDARVSLVQERSAST